MRRLGSFPPRKTLLAAAVIAVSAAGFPTARGQAIVTYGAGLGRAAGAGAAAGTGAAGIFDKLNKTTANAAGHEAKGKPGVKHAPPLAPKPASPNAIAIGGPKPGNAAGDSSTARTTSGISIAGLTKPKPANDGNGSATGEAAVGHESASLAQPAHPLTEPDGFGPPEASLPDPAPPASVIHRRGTGARPTPETAQAGHHEVDAPAADTAPAKTTGPHSAPSTIPAPVLADGITSKAAALRPSAGPVTIAVGTPIQEVIKLLGQPLMRLSGIAGTDYDEHYVFLTLSGAKLTVLAHDGLVLRVISD